MVLHLVVLIKIMVHKNEKRESQREKFKPCLLSHLSTPVPSMNVRFVKLQKLSGTMGWGVSEAIRPSDMHGCNLLTGGGRSDDFRS